jgi:RimJ/RimL family protein N-acetyltransferase
MPGTIPTLQTERLTLRAWEPRDFMPFADFVADGQVNRYRGSGTAMDRVEAWNFLSEKIGQWTLRGYGIFAVEEKASGELSGWCGLWHPIFLDEPELAWSLFPAAQGKGFATEAAERVMRWSAYDLGLPPLFSFVHPNNLPSRKVAERLGAKPEGSTEFRGQPRLLFRHRDLQSSNSNLLHQPEKELSCQS